MISGDGKARIGPEAVGSNSIGPEPVGSNSIGPEPVESNSIGRLSQGANCPVSGKISFL